MFKGAKHKEENNLFNRLTNAHKKMLIIAGSYKSFAIPCVSVAIFRGIYFGLFDSAKPLLPLYYKNSFFVNFLLGWVVTVSANLVSYPINIIWRKNII
jgi:solute carrier family 25 (adenine nucleotide translocator) protein 4/5/6/31